MGIFTELGVKPYNDLHRLTRDRNVISIFRTVNASERNRITRPAWAPSIQPLILMLNVVINKESKSLKLLF